MTYTMATWGQDFSSAASNTAVSALFLCKKCNRMLDLGWKFCPMCGNELFKKEPRKWKMEVYINSEGTLQRESGDYGSDIADALDGKKATMTLMDEHGMMRSEAGVVRKSPSGDFQFTQDNGHIFCWIDQNRKHHITVIMEEIL